MTAVLDNRFVSLVDEGSDLLIRAARLLCGDWATAEEALQRALARAHADWDPRHDDVAAWIELRIDLVSTYLDLVDDADRGAPPGTGPDLLDGLAELDPVVRAGVVARYYLRLSVPQTARALRVPPDRARIVTARALAWLAERQANLRRYRYG